MGRAARKVGEREGWAGGVVEGEGLRGGLPIEITGVDRSTTFVAFNDDGLVHRTIWAGVGDGMLFFDAGNDWEKGKPGICVHQIT